ncbi:MAG: hypothetical protein IPO93_08075 [Actinobacteria bacterium]|jgi:hypothetical protein|nr:hypothetical protein [Actinomycetota bacterium]
MNADTTALSWVFPDVAGRDLLGHEYRLPGEFPAEVSIAVIAFKQGQQAQADAWITRLAQEGIPQTPHGRTDLDKVILELPVLSGRYQVVRRFIDGGMAASIRDPDILARTITLYGSVDGVCEPLGITSREDVSVRVVRHDGSVVWGATGPVTEEGVADLLASLAGPDGPPA